MARRTASNPFVRAATYSSSSTRLSSDRDVQQAVGPGRGRCSGTGCSGGWCASSAVARAPRVDHDVPGAALATPPRGSASRAASCRRGCSPTRTSTSAFGMSSNGNGRPRSIPNARGAGRDGGRHAEPAVVVDVAAAQRDADELAELGRPSRWSARLRRTHPTASRPCAVCVRSDRRGDPVERVVPARGAEPGRRGGVPDERGGPAVRVVEQLRGGGALDAQPTAVDREVRARPISSSEPSGWGVSVIPHCNEQYGQCVATPAVTTRPRCGRREAYGSGGSLSSRVGDRRYASVVRSLRSALSGGAGGGARVCSKVALLQSVSEQGHLAGIPRRLRCVTSHPQRWRPPTARRHDEAERPLSLRRVAPPRRCTRGRPIVSEPALLRPEARRSRRRLRRRRLRIRARVAARRHPPLTTLLGQTIAQHGGPELLELVEQVRTYRGRRSRPATTAITNACSPASTRAPRCGWPGRSRSSSSWPTSRSNATARASCVAAACGPPPLHRVMQELPRPRGGAILRRSTPARPAGAAAGVHGAPDRVVAAVGALDHAPGRRSRSTGANACPRSRRRQARAPR